MKDSGIQEQQSEFLNLFWKLSEEELHIRTHAAVSLISTLNSESQDSPIQIYTLRRLVKGLGSSNKAAREGFSAALCQFLQNNQQIEAKSILEIVMESLPLQGSLSKQEIKDHIFGRIFCIATLARASKFSENVPSDTVVEAIESLFEYQKQKKWLRELCFEVVGLIVSSVDSLILNDVLSAIQREISTEVSNSTSAAEISLLFSVFERGFKSEKDREIIMEIFEGVFELFMTEQGLEAISEPVACTAVFAPRIAMVWSKFFEFYVSYNELFGLFWKKTVEDGLLSSSTRRKEFALLVTGVIMNISTDPVIWEAILSSKFIHSLTTMMSTFQNSLRSQASSVSRKIISVSQSSPGIAALALSQFQNHGGGLNFDKLTKTSTVGSLLKALNREGVQLYIEKVMQALKEDCVSKATVEQGYTLLRNPHVKKNYALLTEIVNNLSRISNQTKSMHCEHTMDETCQDSSFHDGADNLEIGQFAKSRLLSSLSDFVHIDSFEDAKDGRYIDIIYNALRCEEHEIFSLIDSLPSPAVLNSSQFSAIREMLQHLAVVVLLSVDNSVDEGMEEVTDIVGDLHGKLSESNISESEIASLLLDSSLALVSRPIQLFKEIAKKTMREFSDSISSDILQHLLSAVLDNIDMEDEVDGHDAEHSHHSHDEEEHGHEHEIEEEEGEENEILASSDEDDAENSLKDTNCEDSESEIDVDDSNLAESEEDLEAYNVHLENFMRMKKDAKRQAKEEKIQKLHFKLRALDILESMVKKASCSALTIEALLPLIRIMSTFFGSKNSQLVVDKANVVFNRILSKTANKLRVSESQATSVMEEVLQFITEDAKSPEDIQAAQAALFFLFKLLGGDNANLILPIMRGLLKDFFSKKSSKLNRTFFTKAIQRYPTIMWELFPILSEEIIAAKTSFLKLQGLLLSTEIMNYSSKAMIPCIIEVLKRSSTYIRAVTHCLHDPEFSSKNQRLRTSYKALQSLFNLKKKTNFDSIAVGGEKSRILEALQAHAKLPEMKSFTATLKNIEVDLNADETTATAGAKRKSSKKKDSVKKAKQSSNDIES